MINFLSAYSSLSSLTGVVINVALLFYPKEHDHDALEKVTCRLLAKYALAVNDSQQVLSICNEGLNKALKAYDKNKAGKLSFPSFYNIVASQLLMNAARDRNSPRRIPLTLPIDSFEGKIQANVQEPLDLSYLTKKELKEIDLYYFEDLSLEESARKMGVHHTAFENSLRESFKKVRKHYGVPNPPVAFPLKKQKRKLRYKKDTYSKGEIEGFDFLTKEEKTILYSNLIEKKPFPVLDSEGGNKKGYSANVSQRALRTIRIENTRKLLEETI